MSECILCYENSEIFGVGKYSLSALNQQFSFLFLDVIIGKSVSNASLNAEIK